MTTIPANVNYSIINIAFPLPNQSKSPYIPDQTQAKASTAAIISPNNFQAPLNNAYYYLSLWSTSINLEPANNCITIPAVTVGEIPNSINVPRFEANMTLSQQKGSDPLVFTTPYNGIQQATRYMSTIITVHRALVLKRTLLSGSATSGNKASAGLIKFNGLNDI